jgi:hypothetical protein
VAGAEKLLKNIPMATVDNFDKIMTNEYIGGELCNIKSKIPVKNFHTGRERSQMLSKLYLRLSNLS